MPRYKTKLSVCVPVLNAMPYLPERMESIFAQDFQDYEIIICDSYSNDGSWEYIQSLNDKRIRAFQVPRRGIYAGWNECIRRAEGEFIHIATADDLESPNLYSVLIDCLQKNTSIPLAYSKINYIDKNGKLIASRLPVQHLLDFMHRNDGEISQAASHIFSLIHFPPWVSINTVIYRKSLHGEIGLWREDAYSFADCIFARKYYLKYSAIYSSSSSASWRLHSEQSSNLTSKDKLLKFFTETNKAIFLQDIKGFYETKIQTRNARTIINLIFFYGRNTTIKYLPFNQKIVFYLSYLKQIISGKKQLCSLFQKTKIAETTISLLLDYFIFDLLRDDHEALIYKKFNLNFLNKLHTYKLKHRDRLPKSCLLPFEIMRDDTPKHPISLLLFQGTESPIAQEDLLIKFQHLISNLPKHSQIIFIKTAAQSLPFINYSISEVIIDLQNPYQCLKKAIELIRYPITIALEFDDSFMPSAISMLSNQIESYQDIEWILPTFFSIPRGSKSSIFVDISEDNFQFYTTPPFHPGSFPIIFPRLTPISGSAWKSQAIKKLSFADYPTFLHHLPIQKLFLTILALTIKPVYLQAPTICRDSLALAKDLIQTSNLSFSIKNKLQIVKLLSAKNRCDYYIHCLLRLLTILGRPSSLQFQWIKNNLLSDSLKSRQSIPVLSYDKSLNKWQRHEHFFLQSF